MRSVNDKVSNREACGNPYDDIYGTYIRLVELIPLIQIYQPTSMSPDGASHSKTALTTRNGDHYNVTVQSKATGKSFDHPLDPLSPAEVRYRASKHPHLTSAHLSLTCHLSKITTIALSIRHHIAVNTEIKAIKFITCALLPPPKKAVLAYLGIPLSPGGKPDIPVSIVRKAEVDVSQAINIVQSASTNSDLLRVKFLDVVGGCAFIIKF